jgi:hypothetical protein
MRRWKVDETIWVMGPSALKGFATEMTQELEY